jgi:2-keto-4-pentenoate hydratase
LSKLREATESIWRDWQRGVHYPPAWRGKLSMQDGYGVQLGVLQRLIERGERHAGWKVGLTAHAMREQHGVHEPCFGFLLESAHRASDAALALAELTHPGFENELCLTLGATLRGPHVTTEEARAAIAMVAPALEIVEKRGDFAADLPATMADNAQQRCFVTGAAVALDAANAQLSEATVDVLIDREHIAHASGKEVMGDPAASLAWLANKLHEFGLTLEAGKRVISGSFTKQFPITRPAAVEARFTPFGTVRAKFL